MNANMMKKVIEMTKNEAKAAGRIDSDAYKTLNELRASFPGYSIEIKKTKSNGQKGLNEKFMEKYIKYYGDAEGEQMEEFNRLRGLDKAGNADDLLVRKPFGVIKKWFFKEFPEAKKLFCKKYDAVA